MTQSGHRAPLAPGEIRTAIVGDRTFQVMHVAGGSYTQASVRRNGWSSVVLKTDPSSYVAVHAYATAIEQAESDAADAAEGDDAPQFIGAASGELVVPGLASLYPKGTPEYDAYADELKTELAKWVAGEAPYRVTPVELTREEWVKAEYVKAYIDAERVGSLTPKADAEQARDKIVYWLGSTGATPWINGQTCRRDPGAAGGAARAEQAAHRSVQHLRGEHLIHNRYENDPIERERRALVNPDTYRQCLRGFMPGHEGHTDGITAECHLTPPCPREDHAHLAADSMECFDEALPEGAIGGGVGGTCLNMGAGHETHGYARFGRGCVPTAPAPADEPKWRVIITDSESLTGVAPVCDSPKHVEYARRSGMDEGNTGPDWVFDCCPHPQIELWGEANAILVAEIFNQAGAGLAGA